MYLTYQELITFPTFEERFEYLKQNGKASEVTFGGHRLLNQMFYKSPKWRDVRNRVIIRDMGCDLGIKDRPINNRLMIHHLNSITIEQVSNDDISIYDMNNLICCSHRTHNAIHYGSLETLQPTELIERKLGDTKLW